MTATLTSRISVSIVATAADELDLESVQAQLNKTYTDTLANGTGNNQANIAWSDQRTIVASANEDLDLAAGSLQNSLGKIATFTKLKAIYVKAAAANTNNVVVTRPASNGVPFLTAAGDALALEPGAELLRTQPKAGATVTADTGDLINIANSSSGTSVVYDIILIGVGTLS